MGFRKGVRTWALKNLGVSPRLPGSVVKVMPGIPEGTYSPHEAATECLAEAERQRARARAEAHRAQFNR